MIYSVRGKLILKDNNLAVIECGGVGYACRTTLNTLSALNGKSDDVMLYTYMNVREDAVELFGFINQQELSCFKLLISVSGVGPKAALSILSDITHERFALIVASGDSKILTKTKGIGAKTAQRIVLELKDKVAKESLSGGNSSLDLSFGNSFQESNSSVSEAIEGLMVLGFSQGEVVPIIAKLEPTLSSSDLIRETLKIIGMQK